MNKRICFIAQFPPPIHGLSKAVDTLYSSKELTKKFDFVKVDIKNNALFLKSLLLIFITKADLFYFTISQTKGGNIRDLVILKLLELQHKKCLIHLHGGYYRKLVDDKLPRWQRNANYKAIGKLAGAIVLGESLRAIFEGMLSVERIYTVANCVDDQYLMSDEDFNEKISKLKNRSIRHVLYLSNFIRTKGYSEVLEMAKLEKEHCDAGAERKLHFNFAGKFFKKSEENYFFEYIKANQIEKFITYHGIISGDKKRELLKSCDFFTLLTRYPNEGQPISILEAMGNGMLIVSTKHAGIPDIVDERVNILIDNKDINKIIDLRQRNNIIDAFVENRKRINKKYNQKEYIDKMSSLFENI